MFMYGYDTASHITAAYAFETCDALRAAGNACYEVEQAGTGHTTRSPSGGTGGRASSARSSGTSSDCRPPPTEDIGLELAASGDAETPGVESRRATTMSAIFADDSA